MPADRIARVWGVMTVIVVLAGAVIILIAGSC